jgi:hypothetical protein
LVLEDVVVFRDDDDLAVGLIFVGDFEIELAIIDQKMVALFDVII